MTSVLFRYVDFYHEVTGVTSGENIKVKVEKLSYLSCCNDDI